MKIHSHTDLYRMWPELLEEPIDGGIENVAECVGIMWPELRFQRYIKTQISLKVSRNSF